MPAFGFGLPLLGEVKPEVYPKFSQSPAIDRIALCLFNESLQATDDTLVVSHINNWPPFRNFLAQSLS